MKGLVSDGWTTALTHNEGWMDLQVEKRKIQSEKKETLLGLEKNLLMLAIGANRKCIHDYFYYYSSVLHLIPRHSYGACS
jgi:hypothetical protein